MLDMPPLLAFATFAAFAAARRDATLRYAKLTASKSAMPTSPALNRNRAT
jgi:hypothetical protein